MWRQSPSFRRVPPRYDRYPAVRNDAARTIPAARPPPASMRRHRTTRTAPRAECHDLQLHWAQFHGRLGSAPHVTTSQHLSGFVTFATAPVPNGSKGPADITAFSMTDGGRTLSSANGDHQFFLADFFKFNASLKIVDWQFSCVPDNEQSNGNNIFTSPTIDVVNCRRPLSSPRRIWRRLVDNRPQPGDSPRQVRQRSGRRQPDRAARAGRQHGDVHLRGDQHRQRADRQRGVDRRQAGHRSPASPATPTATACST